MTQNFKAIIADDEEHVRDLLALILTSMKFNVVGKATNGEEAIALFNEFEPDIMLLDINMPLITGDEILKSIPQEHNTCIIMLTAVSDKETIKKCIDLGINYFIRKDTPLPRMSDLIKNTWEAFYEKKQKSNVKTYILNGNKIMETKKEN